MSLADIVGEPSADRQSTACRPLI